ncbi:Transmembrane emp24 domain-containing protein [Hondaea fermentalgiana]|uniref:Transmembrane emp24 domain-containing protein n=1 Tax=Hondaea fermentalgiana TaxID=2315210 RepID=A0A2R5GVM5_9STRA|nr:Transmembrane emp24 domain-containing protein [Hondaea fermentalgiana]|eukprot:GBG34379.1 Transmembrane emp24 domain-containing protein [Hondaea fermentalgiana]
MRARRVSWALAALACAAALGVHAAETGAADDGLATAAAAATAAADDDEYLDLKVAPEELDEDDEEGTEDEYDDEDLESNFHMDDFSPSHVFTFPLERYEECFYEEITTVPIRVRMAYFVASGNSQKVNVRVAHTGRKGDAHGGQEKVLHEQTGKTEGTFSTIVREAREYKFCFSNPSGQKKHVTFALHVGVRKREVAKGAEITPLEEAIRAAHHDLNDLVAEQNFIVSRVRRHMLTEDSIEFKVSFYTIVESTIMLGITLAQVFYVQRLINQRAWV